MLMIPLTFFGFYKTYLIQFPHFDKKINYYVHLHALIAVLWIMIIIAQPLLIRARNFKAHRLVGRISYIVFPLLVLSFIPQLFKIIEAGKLRFLFFPVGDAVLLIVFYSLAMYFRKKVYKHMRYVIAGALVFLGPTVGRIGPILLQWSDLKTQNIQYAIIYTILLLLIFFDVRNGKKYQPYIIATAFFALHQLIYYILFL